MAKQCRHIHHEVQPQQNIWRGGEFKRIQPAEVFCADCGSWLYDRPINWDLAPKNARERREMRIDESRTGGGSASPTGRSGTDRRADVG